MMVFLQSGVGMEKLRGVLAKHRVRQILTAAGWMLTGFLLAAASLGNRPQPLVLGMLLGAAPGWPVVCLGVGGGLGYLAFWGQAGFPGLAWTALGMLASAALMTVKPGKRHFWMLPVTAVILTAAANGIFWNRVQMTVPGFFLSAAVAAGGAWVYAQVLDHRDPVCDWLALGFGVLALAQVAPGSWFCLGFFAAGILAASAPLPLAALAGLALDLAQVTKVPMTAVMCAGAAARMLPGMGKYSMAAGILYLPIAALCGVWDLHPLPGLLVGGLLAQFLPRTAAVQYHRGGTGKAQVRLELVSGVLRKTGEFLEDLPVPEPDGDALVSEEAKRCCAGCPCRTSCREQEKTGTLTGEILDQPLVTAQDLPFSCRRKGRMWAHMTRAQEQYRILRADHVRQGEYRQATAEQYLFLSGYLQELSDSLTRCENTEKNRFRPRVAAATVGKEADNGDRCVWFSGPCGNYYVLLCDGMGTGTPAGREAEKTCGMLRELLRAGYPADHALRSLNSFCILRGLPGAVSVDLLRLQLTSGTATLYKWGAPPSYLLTQHGTEEVGTAVPPPGLSVTEGRENRQQLSLVRGERLVLLSDGAGGLSALNRVGSPAGLTPEALAERLLEYGREAGTDDATAAVVQLEPVTTVTR